MLQLKETGAEQKGWTEDFNSHFSLQFREIPAGGICRKLKIKTRGKNKGWLGTDSNEGRNSSQRGDATIRQELRGKR